MDYQNLLVEVKNRIYYITVNREAKLNALNAATLAELHIAFNVAYKDNAVGGIIITGAGTKAFIAGADIAELSALNTETAKEMVQTAHLQVFDFIENGPKPVIAAINGFALGGGLELALAAHIRIAADTSKLGLPEVTLGLIPGYGGTQRLPQLIGKGKAMEMILTAEAITANQAHTYGLVNEVVPAADLLQKAEEMMNKIITRAPQAIRQAIAAINAAGTPNGFATEVTGFSDSFNTADTKEGITAFLQKRKPSFTGN